MSLQVLVNVFLVLLLSKKNNYKITTVNVLFLFLLSFPLIFHFIFFAPRRRVAYSVATPLVAERELAGIPVKERENTTT